MFTDPDSSKYTEDDSPVSKNLDELGDTFFSEVKKLEDEKS